LYAKNITFTKITNTGAGATKKSAKTTVHVDGSSLNATESGGTCQNLNGSIILVFHSIFEEGKDTSGVPALNVFNLTWNITYLPNFQWWEVSNLELHASGPMIAYDGHPQTELDVNWEKAVIKSLAIGAGGVPNGQGKVGDSGYACSKPNRLYYSSDNTKTGVFVLEFRNLHIQPFRYDEPEISGLKPSHFTDNIEDCVPFFSAGVWMFLMSAILFVSIIISGLVMLGNLNTVNRFDDPKSKPLVIAQKD